MGTVLGPPSKASLRSALGDIFSFVSPSIDTTSRVVPGLRAMILARFSDHAYRPRAPLHGHHWTFMPVRPWHSHADVPSYFMRHARSTRQGLEAIAECPCFGRRYRRRARSRQSPSPPAASRSRQATTVCGGRLTASRCRSVISVTLCGSRLWMLSVLGWLYDVVYL